jgi:hypothetical protein
VENLQEVVRDHTAGDPEHEEVVWTYLSPPEIAAQLADRGTPVCADTVRKLLDELGFVQRKAQKRLAMGASPFRNVQFENIAWLKAEYLADLFECDPKTIEHGRQDVAELPTDEAEDRVRKKGGPQKS